MAEKKSNFSVTCNLLSQYLKEKRSFPNISIEEAKGSFQPLTTLNLLSGLDAPAGNKIVADEAVPVSDKTVAKLREPEKAQLTMFYGGKVLVFDDFPADKAAELMNLATIGCSKPNPPIDSSSVSKLNPFKFNNSDMAPIPMARRHSLHRFLEKRKDRINSKAPYQMSGSSKMGPTNKPQEARSWLGLGQEISKLS